MKNNYENTLMEHTPKTSLKLPWFKKHPDLLLMLLRLLPKHKNLNRVSIFYVVETTLNSPSTSSFSCVYSLREVETINEKLLLYL